MDHSHLGSAELKRSVTKATLSAAGLALFMLGSSPPGDEDPNRLSWSVPAPDSCRPQASLRGSDSAEGGKGLDVSGLVPQPGDIIEYSKIPNLKEFLPEEIWAFHDRFFYEGMRLEIGPCHRDYSPPPFFQKATQQAQARLLADGLLENHTHGLPFDPQLIDSRDSQAALKWAWNAVHRYEAAGQFGEIRLSWVSPDRLHARFLGEFFRVGMAGANWDGANHLRLPGGALWAGGGSTQNQSTGERCAWRQYGAAGRDTDIFFYSPSSRRVVRGDSSKLEGLIVGCLAGPYQSLQAHGSAPPKYDWSIVGLRDVLAPINVRTPSFPADPDRNFGPWGISYGSDRWELRRAIVLQGRLREGQNEDRVNRFEWWLDLQTMTPLFYVAYRDDDHPGGAGFFTHRWSEDRVDYPHWPEDSDRAVRVLDSTGAAFADWSGKVAVRSEHFETVSMPPSWDELKRMVSQSSLSRGK